MVDFSFRKYVKQKKHPNEPQWDEFDEYTEEQKESKPTDDYVYSGDRKALNALSSVKPINMATAAVVRILKEGQKAEALGHSVQVTPKQFPKVYDLLSECGKRIHLTLPPLYIRQNPIMNAMTYGLNDDAIVQITSATIDNMSDEEIMYVLGHELGHVKNDHALYLTLLYFLINMSSIFIGWIVAPAKLALTSWTRKSEITADRAGLICCRDLDAATSALVKLALGSKSLYDQVDIDEYLKQIDSIRSSIGKYAELLESHPYLPKRVKALQIFEDSDYYQNVVLQNGINNLPDMKEVDKKVSEILSITD